jgi:hypothetical protein
MQAEMQKVKPEHLKRDAYLYVRQSTPRQVLEHQESTKRQYALRQHAIALGWHSDQIVVIDNDLGNRALPRWIVKVLKSWWPRWAWDTQGW